MKSTDNLYLLIRSLTRSEKRFFKLSSSKNRNETDYIKLFDALEKFGSYDEEKLKKLYAKEGFIKNLSYNKNYLYIRILNSLTDFHKKNSIDQSILELISHSMILSGKSMPDQSIKTLKKALKIAEKYERHELQLEILKQYRNRIAILFYPLKMVDDIRNINVKIKNITDIIINKNKYDNIHSEISAMYIHKGLARSKSEAKQYKEIIDNRYYKDENNAGCFHAKFTFYQDLAVYYLEKGMVEESFNFRAKQIKLVESNKHMGEETPAYFSIAYYNFIHLCRLLQKHSLIPGNLKKLRGIRIKTNDDLSRIVLPSYHMEIGWYIETGQFEKGLEIADEIIKEINKSGNFTTRVSGTILYLYYDLARLYFITGEFDKSVKFISIFFNSVQITTIQIYCNTKILSLLVHFELGSIDLLEYQMRSTYRYLYRKNKVFKFEKTILDFLRISFRVKDNKELIEEFAILQKNLIELNKDTYEHRVIADLFIVQWLKSKTEKKKLIEVIKEDFEAKKFA